VRLYTMLENGHAALTVNADCILEARNVLTALIGDGDLIVRRATPSEADAWLTTASTADRRKMRRLTKKAPAPVKDAGAVSTEVIAGV
jgi:hypothetical protein